MGCVCSYLKQNAFAELSEEQRRSLQDQYEGMWPAAYRAALEGEVSIIFVFFTTGFVLFFLGFKAELQHFGGQARM